VDDDCTLTDAEIEEIGGHIAALVEKNKRLGSAAPEV
jgi:hypothetical protein